MQHINLISWYGAATRHPDLAGLENFTYYQHHQLVATLTAFSREDLDMAAGSTVAVACQSLVF